MARNAFVSSVKAYSTHLKDTKEFFALKELHLGHLAKSFAVREPPKELVVT